MYEHIRNKIYEALLGNKDKKTAILWSGGAYSSVIVDIAYKDLKLRIPVLFVDTGDLPPNLYAHIARVKQQDKIELTIITGKLEDVIKENKNFEVIYTGRPLEGTTTIVPDDPDTWNFIKSRNMKFFQSKK